MTADRLGNDTSTSYLIKDFIDKSHFTISCWTGGRIPKDRWAWGHGTIKTLSVSVPQGSGAGSSPCSQERQWWYQALYGD